jgi:NAD(P)-dependent dehydrogenase (short-subunit alcohol dehydrogenase family)
MVKIWLVTGAGKGFGRLWSEAALKRGDRVIATARDVQSLDELRDVYGEAVLPLQVDVRDRARVFAAVREGREHFGGLDVVLPVAGYGLFGAIEEVSDEEARANLETNVFGTLSVIQAALPILREQGSGHILPVSSLGGVVGLPMFFQATKFAIEGIAEALAQEVAAFGVKVTIVEPGSYSTGFFTKDSAKHAQPIAAYDGMREQLQAMMKPEMFGDPKATVAAILEVVDAAEPPLRMVLGSTALPVIRETYEKRLKVWAEWEAVSNRAQG